MSATVTETPKVYLSQRTDPERGVLFAVIQHGCAAMADTRDRATAMARAMELAGGRPVPVWDGDRGEFLPAGGAFEGNPGPFGDPANRRRLRLEWYAGDLCVVDESPEHSEPFTLAIYWPAGPMDLATFRDAGLASAELYRERGGEYTCRLDGRPIRVNLRDGGRTESVHTVKRAVPAPRVGKATELRWYCGKWEKRTKLIGWRPA